MTSLSNDDISIIYNLLKFIQSSGKGKPGVDSKFEEGTFELDELEGVFTVHKKIKPFLIALQEKRQPKKLELSDLDYKFILNMLLVCSKRVTIDAKDWSRLGQLLETMQTIVKELEEEKTKDAVLNKIEELEEVKIEE